MSVAAKFSIAHRWDGARLEPSDVVGLSVDWRGSDLRVSLEAPYYAELAPNIAPGWCPGLWNFEVVELFFAWSDEYYLELEFGPHGHFLGLIFENIRADDPEKLSLDHYDAKIDGDRWYASALLTTDRWATQAVRYNAFAIHGASAQRHYAAHSPLPGSHPDFHQPSRFPRWPAQTATSNQADDRRVDPRLTTRSSR